MSQLSAAGAELAAMDVAGRLARLRTELAEVGVDGFVVTNLTNVRYLSGFTGSAATLIVTDHDAVLVTDGRYRDQAPAQVEACGADVHVEISETGGQDPVHRRLATLPRVGLEADTVTWSQMRSLDAVAGERALVPTSGLVERLRITKDAGEVDRMVRAAAIADDALADVVHLLAEGLTERAFGLALDTRIRELGASGKSVKSVVASGPNGALPHARPTDRVIEAGDLVVVDFGAVVDGYCSDMSRTFGIGAVNDDRQAMFDAVIEAQAAGVAAVSAGVAASEVDRACREVLVDHGLEEFFTHGTGHGVGLDIHEAPRVSSVSDATLAAGFVVTVEPGVYRTPVGGVRVEDTVVVSDAGCRVLTTSPKTLLVG